MTIDEALQALYDSAIGAAMRENELWFPLIETVHVLALTVVVGSIAVLDLRLLGLASRGRPVSKIVSDVLPVTWSSFALAVVSGVFLFASNAVAYAHNAAMQGKLIALALLGLNAAVFHRFVGRRLSEWEGESKPPRPARVAGATSIGLWLAVIVFGRWIGFTINDVAAEDAVDPIAALQALPDWSGLWTPLREEGKSAFGQGEPTWTPQAQVQFDALKAAEKSGVPRNIYIDCLPEGMPSYVIMTLNAQEFLFTPGRVTILGEFDGNRLRRIYTDGRGHPTDPDPTFNGHSIGHWEGDVLVVDTIGLLPQNFLPLGQALGLPNNGDMHIVEHIRPIGPDQLRFELEITAPKMLAKPWLVTRTFTRLPDRGAEIVEASCRQGDFIPGKDASGNDVWLPIAHDQGGAPLPTGS
ncbi:MAG: DUF6644 family protein [Polyangiales bacterium]